MLTQIVPVVAVLVYSFVVAFILGKVIDLVMGFRVTEHEEIAGVDNVLHGGGAYKFD